MSATESLESAISDVGYWTWWTADLPNGFQIEFGGVQLWTEPDAPNKPPSSQIALQFGGPKLIAFLNQSDQPKDLPKDWPLKLQQDELSPFTITNEAFTLSSLQEVKRIFSEAASINILFGNAQVLEDLNSEDAIAGFWAGPVGLIVVAAAMRPVTFSGPLTPQDVEQMHEMWWQYWKEYWSRKDTANPMPEDDACEVTIPAEEFDKMPPEFFENLDYE
jgi:hypothetical protein